MVKIRLFKTGEIKEVERNDAHALIQAGEAELVQSFPEYNKEVILPEQAKRGRPKKGYTIT